MITPHRLVVTANLYPTSNVAWTKKAREIEDSRRSGNSPREPRLCRSARTRLLDHLDASRRIVYLIQAGDLLTGSADNFSPGRLVRRRPHGSLPGQPRLGHASLPVA